MNETHNELVFLAQESLEMTGRRNPGEALAAFEGRILLRRLLRPGPSFVVNLHLDERAFTLGTLEKNTLS